MAKDTLIKPAPWMRLETQSKRLQKAAKELDKPTVALAVAQILVACNEIGITKIETPVPVRQPNGDPVFQDIPPCDAGQKSN